MKNIVEYIYLMLAANNHQNIRSRCLIHEFSLTILIIDTKQLYSRKIICGWFRFIWIWLLIAITKRCTQRCALQLHRIFILFQLRSWIIFRVWTRSLLRNIHTKRVIFEIAMMNIFNSCIAGSLSNNYFRLNESSNLYWQCFVYSITTWKTTYLKNYSKNFHALILAHLLAILNKQLTAPWVIILTKYIQVFVTCLLMRTFFISLTLNLLRKNN